MTPRYRCIDFGGTEDVTLELDLSADNIVTDPDTSDTLTYEISNVSSDNLGSFSSSTNTK